MVKYQLATELISKTIRRGEKSHEVFLLAGGRESRKMDKNQPPNLNVSGRGLKFLRPHHIELIDSALSSVGEYGEIHLIVEKGQLRFVVTQTSYDAMKWRPGMILGDANHQGLDV